MRADPTGKISLDHIYTGPDPRSYFSTLRKLDYQIPQLAKPYFLKIIQERRDTAQADSVQTVLDIGCSYGINAALLRCDATMDELYERYSGPGADARTHDELVALDRDMLHSRDRARRTRFIGLDNSGPALSYALEAGFLDATVHTDLEVNDPAEEQREDLATADIVISTGCLGYVTEKTIARVVQAHGDRKPWMAHFVLRMFPFEPIAETLAEAGYDTVRCEGVFKQRRFATGEEQSQVLDRLSSVGVDPSGLESDGSLYAELFTSRPRAGG